MLEVTRSTLALEALELALEILRAKKEGRLLPEVEIYQKLLDLQEFVRKGGKSQWST